MEQVRKPFQGVGNVIRFNWHFYLISLGAILVGLFFSQYLHSLLKFLAIGGCFLAILMTSLSLIVSYYVYDWAGIYQLNWVDANDFAQNGKIININAGFDEISFLLEEKFKDAKLIVFDFYNPTKHTEISIERARKAYPHFPETQQISTSELPLYDNSADIIFLTFSAHEIRDENERIIFFNQLHRVLKPDGKIYVTEHLRDLANFLAYNIGFFHFHSKASWYKVFKSSNFKINREIKLTPFVSTFILTKNGTTS